MKMESLPLNMVSKNHQPLSAIEWLPLVRIPTNNLGFTHYNDTFMKLVFSIFYGVPLSSIFLKYKILLQLPRSLTCDWYLYQHYTIIRVYGFEHEAYMLPVFLTPRIFSLEYIRQVFFSDKEHFSGKKQATIFKLPQQIGPFLAKSRSTVEYVEKILQQMHFLKATKWVYSPHGLISFRKHDKERGNYVHQKDEFLEKRC